MIEVDDLLKIFGTGNSRVRAVDGVTLRILRGEFDLFVGRSGSGKSTLLSMLCGLTKPSGGRVKIDGRDIWNLNDRELSLFRAKDFGFVFQFSGLLPTLTAKENVMLPVLFSGQKQEAGKRAEELLDAVGLTERAGSYPSTLSGGELKRVAIARSLMNDPPILFADEPTGDLDIETEREIMDLFKEINRNGKTIIMVTHNPDLGAYATRVFRMDKGKVYEDGRAL